MKVIPHSKPTIQEDDIKAVSAVLKRCLISQGEGVERFEKLFSKYHGIRGGVAVSSGTAALHIALLALGIGKGDGVIVPTYACIAPYNAVRYTGATPVLADTVKDGWAMDAERIEDYLKRDSKRRVRAIIVVHLFGNPVNMDAFMEISKRRSIPVIEDCALSLGAEYKGKKVGAFGEISIFSFYATKVITTGEGGMLISNSREILDRAMDLREYDEKKDDTLRFNYKMTDFQAAMGISQLKKLPKFIEQRRRIAKNYLDKLQNLPLSLPDQSEHTKDIYHRFVVKIKNADRFIDAMRRKGITCKKPVFMPVHRIVERRALPNAEKIWKEAVSLPIYPSLDKDAVKRIIGCTKKIIEGMRINVGSA
ncbi:MAG: DegT/DnrJ/EryC1/StrS aminotransferase family protein [Nitrospirae bacterium]|nr:DegT/DnrJ/EryC1/StrS aminotransferase family protein [Nitrospirota bacterium]